VQPPHCKNDIQKFLGKLNYLRRFIVNLSGKINVFAPILRLKNKADFTWGGVDQQRAFDDIKRYLSSAIHRCRGCRDWGCFDANGRGQGMHHYIL
jgi:hypothetical protein